MKSSKYWIRSIQANFIIVLIKITTEPEKKNKPRKSKTENTRKFNVQSNKIQGIACVKPIKERCTRKNESNFIMNKKTI